MRAHLAFGVGGASSGRAVSMSRIADETGIGRATLYKYFPDVETIMTTWHKRQVTQHLQQLANRGKFVDIAPNFHDHEHSADESAAQVHGRA